MAVEATAHKPETTIDVALKIWRSSSATGERELKLYEFEAPEWVTLLDCLDIVKDRLDGSLAYRKSCRMMICGSCGMRMDGAAVLACKTRMYDIARSGHVPVVSAMGNLPIVKDLVVDMEPFWAKFKAMKPYLQPGYDQPLDGREHVISQERMNVIHKESLCINCGCCVSECNAWDAEPEFLGPQALAKGMRFVGDPRDAAKVERLDEYSGQHGIWECTRCYFCNERCPKGVDPRDAIAKLGAEAMKEGIDQDMGAKHANWFVTSAKTTGWLRETELVPKTQGIVSSIKEMKFAMGLAKHGKVPLPFPPHVAEGVKESRALYDLVKEQDRQGAMGIVQGEHALGRLEHAHEEDETRERGRGVRKVAYYKGCLASLSAKELDISTQALSPKVGLELIELETVTCCGAGDIHEAEPDYYLHLNARILAYAEATGCDTLMTVCNVCTLNLRQANFQLQGDEALRDRVNKNLAKVGVPEYNGTVEVLHFLWLVAAGDGYDLLQQAAHKGLKGLKVAPFYGCQILRPSKLLGFEDPDKPDSLERIIEACGGEPIDYPAKIKCCGFPIIQAREETALQELIQPIEQAKEAGADAMVTPCPLCHLSLDAWQTKLKKQTGKDFQMPILHLSQLIGVAAGLTDSELKFKRHIVSVDPVLEKLSV